MTVISQQYMLIQQPLVLGLQGTIDHIGPPDEGQFFLKGFRSCQSVTNSRAKEYSSYRFWNDIIYMRCHFCQWNVA